MQRMCKERQEGKERKRIRKIERGIQRKGGKMFHGKTLKQNEMQRTREREREREISRMGEEKEREAGRERER